MITDEQARWIALFFLFALMEERVALQAAHKTVAQLKAQGASARADASSDEPKKGLGRPEIIRAMTKVLEPYRRLASRAKPAVFPDAVWRLPAQFDIDPWTKFQKSAAANEVVAVILSKLLPFTDHEIAEGLGVSLGTARYRVGKGIRQLGAQFEVLSRRST